VVRVAERTDRIRVGLSSRAGANEQQRMVEASNALG